jgi:hypothetical protein
MGFFTAITFCIGASVADADTLNDCGWAVFPTRMHETEAQCQAHIYGLFTNSVFMNGVRMTVESHPEFEGEWSIDAECVAEEDWPEYYEYISSSEDTAI